MNELGMTVSDATWRVLVCGSRDVTGRACVWLHLDALHATRPFGVLIPEWLLEALVGALDLFDELTGRGQVPDLDVARWQQLAVAVGVPT